MSTPSNPRRATILDVAGEAGVSRAAVSKVIRGADGVSDAMRTRVMDAIGRLDYRPSAAARGLRGSSFTLGMELPTLTNPFLNEVAEGARAALVGTAYQLVVAPADGSQQGAIESLVDHRVDGIIAVSPLVRREWLEELAARAPLVMIGRHDDPIGYDTVVGDDVHGAESAMSHLVGLGHQRIAHLTMSKAVTAKGIGTPHELRLNTYLRCMKAAKLKAAVVQSSSVVQVDDDQPPAYDATRALLNLPLPPTAIFAAHDSLAIAVLAAVADAGLTARDVSVIGYDNTRLAGHPLISLTSVDQSGDELGRQAIAMLLERINGRLEPRRYTAMPRLVVRNSTAPAP
ncbi:MAG: LacI family DNA-binding transcriptional regulator [Vicinamibacterales bacterium]